MQWCLSVVKLGVKIFSGATGRQCVTTWSSCMSHVWGKDGWHLPAVLPELILRAGELFFSSTLFSSRKCWLVTFCWIPTFSFWLLQCKWLIQCTFACKYSQQCLTFITFLSSKQSQPAVNALKELQKCEFRSVEDEMHQAAKCLKPQMGASLSQPHCLPAPGWGEKDVCSLNFPLHNQELPRTTSASFRHS